MALTARRRKFLVLYGCLVVALWCGLAAYRLYFRPYRIPTGSMIPALLPGDHVYARMCGPGVGYRPTQGDIIVYRYPRDPNLTYVHRCVAVAGDSVTVHEGIMRINGQVYESALDDPQADHGCVDGEGVDCPEPHTIHDAQMRGRSPLGLEFGPFVVPAGHVFVAGDNRFNSADSRYWGPLPDDHVLGRVGFIYWSATPGRMFKRVR